MKNSLLLSVLLLGLALACGPRGGGGQASGTSGGTSQGTQNPAAPPAEAPAATHSFPKVAVPTVYEGDSDAVVDYVLDHYWDAFLAGKGATTPESILGIYDVDVEQALADYIQLLSNVKAAATPDSLAPLNRARKSVGRFFSNIEALQQKDTSSNTYLRLTEMVSHYLYDPNSPLRDEDLYLPFVQKMAASPLTKEDMRTAYRYEAQMCALNPRGSVAPDFVMTLRGGTQVRMHSVRAERTLLFFSNPGCHNCKEIIDALQADDEKKKLESAE